MKKNNKKSLITPESIFDYSVIEDPQFSPDGNLIAFVQMKPDEETNSYRRSIWFVKSVGNAQPVRFTSGGSDFCPRFSPDGEKLAFISRRNGTNQIFIIPLKGGEASQITYMVNGVSDISWSPDSRWIAFISESTLEEHSIEDSNLMYCQASLEMTKAWAINHQQELKDPRLITKLPYRTGTSFFDGKYRHVYIISSTGGMPKRLSNGTYHHAAPDWSIDSKFVISNTNRDQSSGDENFELWSSIIQFDIASGKETVLVSEVSEEGREVFVSPNGDLLAYTLVSKSESPYADPYYVAVSPNRPEANSKKVSSDSQTVVSFKWDIDNEHLYFLIHEKGDGKIVRTSILTGDTEDIVTGKRMVEQFSISKSGQKIAYTSSAPTDPSNLYILDIKTNKTRQLTNFNAQFIENHLLSQPVELLYKSENDREIQGWYFRPANYDPEHNYPVAVEIHGGPQIMWGNSFWHEFQVLCSRGYYVFFCNPRGSAGYGTEFQRIRGKGGYTDMPDIMNGVKALLGKEKNADQARLCVTGGSYGGFLTGWVVTHTDIFKAAVSQRGVYDELNMFGSGDIPESVEWYHDGAPSTQNLLELWDYSPVAHSKKVTTPLLILHSELDYRCPISQAESFFAHLRRNGNRDVQMLRFPREGHELSRRGEPQHRVERLNRIVDWFDKHIDYHEVFGREVDKKEFHRLFPDLKDWKIEQNKVKRVVYCGNGDIGNLMMNKLHHKIKTSKSQIAFLLNEKELTIEIQNESLKTVTLNEVYLAKKLNRFI